MRLHPLQAFVAECENEEECACGDDPRDRIGCVEHAHAEEGVFLGGLDGNHSEYRKDPDDTQDAGAEERGDHRGEDGEDPDLLPTARGLLHAKGPPHGDGRRMRHDSMERGHA